MIHEKGGQKSAVSSKTTVFWPKFAGKIFQVGEVNFYGQPTGNKPVSKKKGTKERMHDRCPRFEQVLTHIVSYILTLVEQSKDKKWKVNTERQSPSTKEAEAFKHSRGASSTCT